MTDLIYVEGTSPGAVCYGVRRQFTGYPSGVTAHLDKATEIGLRWLETECDSFLGKFTCSREDVPEKHWKGLEKQLRRHLRSEMGVGFRGTFGVGPVFWFELFMALAKVAALLIQWWRSSASAGYRIARQAMGAREQ